MATSTFDTDLDGWTGVDSDQIAWSKTGGNPGGCLRFTDATSNTEYIIAPQKFLAPAIDYKKYNGKGYFVWQQKIVSESGASGSAPYADTISGPGGTAVYTAAPPNLNDSSSFKFVTIIAPLTQPDWVIKSGTWNAILADVTSIQLQIDVVDTTMEVEDIDNISFVSTKFTN